MSELFEVEPLGDHEFLLRVRAGEETVESTFRASASITEELHVASADEQRLVERTAEFLIERQPVIDLPPFVDLDDVAASYGDYLELIGRRLGPSGH